MTPEAARKLTEGAISYAKGLGFSPAADYKKASRAFGGITTANCNEQFVFGKNGKPLYTHGLSESPACVERILRTLEARCGEGGYDYILAGDSFEPFYGEEPNGESAIADPVRRIGLEQMATGLRINPTGHRKVPDMIWLVAEPLLKSAPDYESQEMILELTTLAWNFTLLDPNEQEEMLAKIADLFPCPEYMDIFYYLADRKELLFPEEEHIICRIETGSPLYSDIALRAASAM
jgi:hypothetical protein